MRVFMTGATGVLGRRLARRLAAAGDQVVGLSRSDANDRTLRGLGVEPARADLFDPQALAKAAKGSDAIVHAASAIPTGQRPFSWHWRENDRIRTEGTRSVVRAAREAGVPRVLFPSVTWVARQPDGRPFDEDAPLHVDRVTRTAAVSEEILRDAAREGLSTTVLRCGFFYAPESAHLRAFREGFARGRVPVVGDGRARIGLVHVEDAAAAFEAALRAGASGTFHVVDDEPVQVATFFDEFARRAGGPRPRRVPAWLARPLAGSNTVDFLTIPSPTSHARLTKATGWRPRFPTYREGLDDLFAAWAREAAAPAA